MKRPLPHDKPSSGAYTIVDPVTKVPCSGTTFDALLNRIGQVRSAVGAVAGLDLRREVEDKICEQYPEECTEVDMTIPRLVKLNLSDVIRGTRVMTAQILSGAKPVDRDEALRRGAICRDCKYNQNFPSTCTGICGWLKDIAIQMSGNQGTEHDRCLHGCAICHCFLQAAIWMPLDIQCLGVTADMAKQFQYVKEKEGIPCWKQCS